MNLNMVPEKLAKKICNLQSDEEFQKLYGEDKILDELDEERKQHPEKNDEIYEKMNRRMCQFVVDYLLEKGQIEWRWNNKFIQKCCREGLIRLLQG